MPAPSSGGIAVGQMLGILQAAGFRGLADGRGGLDVDGVHRFSEAGRLAYADREWRGVPRHIIGLMTDWRSAFPNEPLNAMIFGALDELHRSVGALLARLAELA